MPIDKIIDPNVVSKAYTNNIDISARKTEGDDDSSAAGGGVSFSQFMEDNARGAIQTMKGSEAMAAKAVSGEADLTDVVEAVTAAELTLQTVVAVRDRLVSAYQEIMRLPI